MFTPFEKGGRPEAGGISCDIRYRHKSFHSLLLKLTPVVTQFLQVINVDGLAVHADEIVLSQVVQDA